jgi:hypothetical protein
VPDLIPAVDEACAVGVLAESSHGLGFRHPLIRSALYDEMPAPVRAAWHRDAGRTLAAAGAPPDRVARQMLRAVGEPGDTSEPVDEWMLEWLARVADLLVARRLGSRPNFSPGRRQFPGWLGPTRMADQPTGRCLLPSR